MKTAPCCQLLEGQLESLLSLSGCRHIACHREGNKFTRTASPSVTNRDTAETKGQASAHSSGLILPHLTGPSLGSAGVQMEAPLKSLHLSRRYTGDIHEDELWVLKWLFFFHHQTWCWSLQPLPMGKTLFGSAPSLAQLPSPRAVQPPYMQSILLRAWVDAFGLLVGLRGHPRRAGGSGCKSICLGPDGWFPTLLKSDCLGSALVRRCSTTPGRHLQWPNLYTWSKPTNNSGIYFEVIFST